MAPMAQAALHRLRKRLGEPHALWDAAPLARDLFRGLDGDIRVQDGGIHVTFYKAPNAKLLARHYEKLSRELLYENVNPRIPWPYNFKFDFHFKWSNAYGSKSIRPRKSLPPRGMEDIPRRLRHPSLPEGDVGFLRSDFSGQ